MHNYRFLALTLLVALTAGSVGSIAASSAGASASSEGDHTRVKTVHVVEHAITDAIVDVGPAGDSLGDILAFGNPIFDGANAHEIGRDQGYCVRTNVSQSWECNWTVILDRGGITVEGPFYDDLRDSQFAITGGTGAYRSAQGEMTLHARDAAGTEFDFVYHLILRQSDDE